MRRASGSRRQRTAAELLYYICICKLLHSVKLQAAEGICELRECWAVAKQKSKERQEIHS